MSELLLLHSDLLNNSTHGDIHMHDNSANIQPPNEANEVPSVQEETGKILAQNPGGFHQFMQGVAGMSDSNNPEGDFPGV